MALLLSAAGDGGVVVGNAVDHPDEAVEVLLMYTASEPEGAEAHCMLLGLGALPDEDGAENAVVFADVAEPAAQTPHVRPRLVAIS